MVLGRTLPSLLDDACDRSPNAQAFNQSTRKGWQSWSNQAVRSAAEALALGLQGLGFERGDRVALLMESDVAFCIVDMACLLAGLVNVPIYLGEAPTNVLFILQHSGAKALILSDLDLLCQVIPCLTEVPELKTFIVVEGDSAKNGTTSDAQVTTNSPTLPSCPIVSTTESPCIPVPTSETEMLPQGIQVLSLGELQVTGETRLTEAKRQQLRSAIAPSDLATIVYITGATAQFQRQTSHSQEQPTTHKLVALFQQYFQFGIRNSEFGIRNKEKPHSHSISATETTNLEPRTPKSELRSRSVSAGETPNSELRIPNSEFRIPNSPDLPKGVMLTHENLSGNALAAFSSMPGLEWGDREVVLSFLPLSHVFARTLIYGHIYYGHSLYFSSANRVVRHLQEIHPTVFTTVPRLLEKVYDRILEKGQRLKGMTQRAFNWALRLARHYSLGQTPSYVYQVQQRLADRFVFSQWRSVFGGRLKFLISGGAALQGEIATVFSAAGIPVLQGYGLTEASAVVCFNRGELNRAGTVGVPIPGVEVAIAATGEILVRSPYVMQGFYNNPEATAQALEPDGWLHTGDLGEFTPDGFLRITGCKKDLFKLSTGKYVVPLALERKVKQSPLVTQAIAVGAHRKFCSMLIFPDLSNLLVQAQAMGLDLPIEDLLQHPQVLALYQTLVDEANKWLPSWSTVKLFRLINPALTPDYPLTIPTLAMQRKEVDEVFASEISTMYVEG